MDMKTTVFTAIKAAPDLKKDYNAESKLAGGDIEAELPKTRAEAKNKAAPAISL
ncbi:MAG: hypothetical protein V1492_01385 [Candidatus Micrarchaeota archaeon]